MSMLSGVIRSFANALRGIAFAVRTQPNLRFHFIATIAVILAGILVKLSRMEWALITVAIGLVWVSELINTALETLVDLTTPQQHPLARVVKDVAAGAVLVAAIAAVAIGLFVFIPKF